ncbi:MAG: UDP-N-acetylmuramoyl-L-alanyl-D-glutamate--2,6-diaminopimelate ligase [Halanaerobiaceae bacterium]|nr:UDP-N-acetylmuramoyl-L-alanyl-D-glutamate--2,6-diaminopimelate ligase [Halanaerobiaceae bacterium]
MILRDLIKDIIPLKITGRLDKDIKKIVYDSRQAEQDSLFICIEGFRFDGHDFIAKAVENGASAVLVEKDMADIIEGITYIKVQDTRTAMAGLAASFYDYPLKKIDLIGITRTNGKTTTTYLVKNMMDNIGRSTALIGTIKNIIGDRAFPATRTTPESLDLYELYSKMLAGNIYQVVMEVSSHALDLKRVSGMEFKAAVFTNITQDHLDYHKSFEEYINAKCRLFRQLKSDGYAVINLDDPNSGRFIKSSRGRVITYAVNKEADLKVENIILTSQGVSFEVRGLLNLHLDMKITGLFNVYNTLAAAGCAYACGLNEEEIKKGLESVRGVDGRFETIEMGQDFSVIVDYAHTPDGMENVLKTALELVEGRLITVFGCGGDRDKGKRPEMGRIAAKYSDFIVLTSDNPRSEEPMAIIGDIEAGIKGRKTAYDIIPDRREAIFSAVKRARKGDLIIILGKGHESYQIFKDKTIPFDDRETAREAIESILGDGNR